MCTMYALYRQSSATYSGHLLKATPARVSRLVTATYDTSGMCGRGHCIAKKATRRLINIPRGRHIGNFVVARSFRHIYAINFRQFVFLRDFGQFFGRD